MEYYGPQNYTFAGRPGTSGYAALENVKQLKILSAFQTQVLAQISGG